MFGEPRSGSPHVPSTGSDVSNTRGRVSSPPEADNVRPSAANWGSTYSPFTSDEKSRSISMQASGVGGDTVASEVGGSCVGSVSDGETDGSTEGITFGDIDGDSDGEAEGNAVGLSLGELLGTALGDSLGLSLGERLGTELGGDIEQKEMNVTAPDLVKSTLNCLTLDLSMEIV